MRYICRKRARAMLLTRLAVGASAVRVLGTAALSAEDAALCRKDFPPFQHALLCRDVEHLVTCLEDKWCQHGEHYDTTLKVFRKACTETPTSYVDEHCGTYSNPDADIFAPIILGLTIAVCVIAVWAVCFGTCDFACSRAKQRYAGEQIRATWHSVLGCLYAPFSCLNSGDVTPEDRAGLLGHGQGSGAAFPCAPAVVLVPVQA
jgi:hypothetical protein